MRDGIPDSGPLQWHVLADSVSRGGVSREYNASPEECAAIARFLDIVAVNRLNFACRLSRRDAGRIYVCGALKAEVVQACVITCEPVTEALEEPVEAEFQAETDAHDHDSRLEIDLDAEDVEPPEVMRGGRVELGALTVEILSLSLDPYPRAAGAEYHSPANDCEMPASGPFAALARLKKRPD